MPLTETTGGIITQPVPGSIITSGANTNSLNSVVWTVWNNTHSTMTITNAATTNMTYTTSAVSTAAWNAWNIQYVLAASVTTAVTSTVTQTPINQVLWTEWNNLYHATAEQVAEAHRRTQEYQAQQASVRLERSLAEKRAEVLLQEVLSAQQREELAAKGFFTLKTLAKSGEERIYRIRRGRSRNIDQVDASGRRIRTLCAHPASYVPDADTMVAQKLMLESQEEDFLRIANVS